MKLGKRCGCCKKELTTKNVKVIGRNELGLWYNCECKSTGILAPKKLPVLS